MRALRSRTGSTQVRASVDRGDNAGGDTRAEFELGLEMDSAEVRGVLFYEGQEWSRVVFDFLN